MGFVCWIWWRLIGFVFNAVEFGLICAGFCCFWICVLRFCLHKFGCVVIQVGRCLGACSRLRVQVWFRGWCLRCECCLVIRFDLLLMFCVVVILFRCLVFGGFGFLVFIELRWLWCFSG